MADLASIQRRFYELVTNGGAVADDDAVIGHDTGADDGVRRRAAEPAASVLERPPHPPQVRLRRRFGASFYHFC